MPNQSTFTMLKMKRLHIVQSPVNSHKENSRIFNKICQLNIIEHNQ